MIAAAAAGEARNAINTFAASGSFEAETIPAANTVTFCWKPSSASPRARDERSQYAEQGRRPRR